MPAVVHLASVARNKGTTCTDCASSSPLCLLFCWVPCFVITCFCHLMILHREPCADAGHAGLRQG